MGKDFLQEFINEATKENEARIAQEKRKKHFQKLGRKGGLKTKENKKLDKVISIRMTNSEYDILVQKQIKLGDISVDANSDVNNEVWNEFGEFYTSQETLDEDNVWLSQSWE